MNGSNPYTYVNSNPTNWVDPFGLEKGLRGAIPGFHYDLRSGGYFPDVVTAQGIGGNGFWATTGDYFASGEAASATAAGIDVVTNNFTFGLAGKFGAQLGPQYGKKGAYSIGAQAGQVGYMTASVAVSLAGVFELATSFSSGGGGIAGGLSSGGELVLASEVGSVGALDAIASGGLAFSGGVAGGGAENTDVGRENCSPNSSDQTSSNSWHKGTFDDPEGSLNYHWKKHAEAFGKTPQQYTQDALDFFNQNKNQGFPLKLKDGTIGIKIPGQPGGIFTKSGDIVTFWYD